jgi:putative ABC transport system permease protein
MTGGVEPVRLIAERITTNFLSVLGVEPIIGRGFAADEYNQPEAVTILSHSTWQTVFGGDREILQRQIEIDGVPHRIIGVLPELGFFSYGINLWTPMRDPTSSEDRAVRSLTVMGRVAPEIAVGYMLFDPRPRVPELHAELAVLSKQLAESHPDIDREWSMSFSGVVPMRTSEVVVSALFMITPVFVLAIACANVANLLLARAVGRKRDISVRIALGASRFRIVRLLMVESVLYALAGAAVGVALGVWGVDLLRGFDATPFWSTAQVDVFVLAGSLAVAGLSALFFGLTPASQTLRLALIESLKHGAANVAIDRKGHRLRTILMTSQVAAATLLLILVGLTLRSALRVSALDLGFQMDRVLTFRLEVPEYSHPDSESVAQTHLRIVENIRALPGIEYAGIGTRVPTAGSRNNHSEQLEIPGRAAAAEGEGDWAVDLTISPGYLEALRIPLLRGRSFSSADTAASQPVALVSKATVDRYWPNGDVIGKTVRLVSAGPAARWMTIVGVAGDVRNDNASAPPLPMLYLPMSQHPIRGATYVLQASTDVDATTAAVRTAVRAAEPNLPVFNFQTMNQVVESDLVGLYFPVRLLGAFAGLAFFLAMVGMYGVLSHLTSERSAEIAVRVALGARPGQVIWAFVSKGMRITLYGVIAGIGAGFLVSPVLRSVLFGVSATDPTSFAVVTATILAVALAACFLPARRAAKRDPMSVLRCE